MTGIPRDQLMKELLPGLNKLFGMEYESYDEDWKMERLKKEIEESDNKFIPRAAYKRIIDNYEAQIKKREDAHEGMIKTVARTAREDGVKRAADLVEGMAEELGNSNLLHAVVLALHNMEIPE